MNHILLMRLSLACALTLCTQPLLGMENTNPYPGMDQANINRPQEYGQQVQQAPVLFAPQQNTLPWMDIVPQNQTVSLLPLYINTPGGIYVVYQTINQTVNPFAQDNPMPIAQNNQGQMTMSIFSSGPFPAQQQAGMQPMMQQVPDNTFSAFQQNQNRWPETQNNNNITTPQGMGGMKRPWELDTNENAHQSAKEPLFWGMEQDYHSSESTRPEDTSGEDPGYCQLVDFEQNITRAMTIFLLPNAMEAELGIYIPKEVIHLVVKACCPLIYHLNLRSNSNSRHSRIGDEDLLKFKFPRFVTGLSLYYNQTISDYGLKPLTNLTSLDLFGNDTITDDGLKPLTKLTILDLDQNCTITDDGLKPLTNLTSLNLLENNMITDEGLKSLTSLINLDLYLNQIITDDGLKPLTSLTSLELRQNPKITDDGLEPLTNLTRLTLNRNSMITDKGLEPLTNLTSLRLIANPMITDKGLEPLRNLTDLDLFDNQTITIEGIKRLPRLNGWMVRLN